MSASASSTFLRDVMERSVAATKVDPWRDGGTRGAQSVLRPQGARRVDHGTIVVARRIFCFPGQAFSRTDAANTGKRRGRAAVADL